MAVAASAATAMTRSPKNIKCAINVSGHPSTDLNNKANPKEIISSLGNNRGSGGKNNSSYIPRRRRWLLLLVKLGLAISISYQFIWAANKLSKLVVAVDIAGIDDVATMTKKNHAEEYSNSSIILNDVGATGINNGNQATTPIVKNTSSRSLPSYPLSDKELQSLVSYTTNHTSSSSCPEGLIYVSDHILSDKALTHPPTTRRLIPHILHFTSKSRCMTPAFASNIQLWKDTLGSHYSIHIHDDDAVDCFIYKQIWTEFPELKEIMACVTAGVSLSEIYNSLYRVLRT